MENSIKVIFGSVVYKKAQKYLEDFLVSVENQAKGKFSLLLINDDINMEELKKIVMQYSIEINIINIPNRTPVQLRIELLKWAKYEQADLLIIGDCDDVFSNTRVIDTIYTYMSKPKNIFYYNEIKDMHGKKIMPELPQSIQDFREIGEYNFLGLSNTALNIKEISYEFIDSLLEYSDEVFDWYLFSRILLTGKQGKKVNGCYTMYRLHENNIAGIQRFNEYNLRHEIEVKVKHYACLQSYHSYYAEKYWQYKWLKKYKLLKKQENYFWWNLLKIVK